MPTEQKLLTQTFLTNSCLISESVLIFFKIINAFTNFHKYKALFFKIVSTFLIYCSYYGKGLAFIDNRSHRNSSCCVLFHEKEE